MTTQDRNLALFDFDGSIIRKDSFWDFIQYTVGHTRYIQSHVRLALPIYLKFHAGIFSNGQAKERIMDYHFRGWRISDFNEAAKQYAHNRIDKLLIPEAAKAIEQHKAQGDHIVVVSGSFENWLRPWCEKHGIDVLGSRLEVVNGMLSGQMEGKDCIGEEKVNRINAFLNPSNYSKIYGYGDSSGDKEMLALCDVKYYKWKRI